MKKSALFLIVLSVSLVGQFVLSCRTSNVLPGRVPYQEYVDSLSKTVKEKSQIPSKKGYTASGGLTYSQLRANMMLNRAISSNFSEEELEKKVKASLSHWMDHPLDIGGFPVVYEMSNDEKLKVYTRFNHARTTTSAVFHVDSAYVERGGKKIPVEISSTHFTMVRNPPLEYVFTCNFKYRRKWYSLYHHVNIEKTPSFKGHETKCELLR